MNHDVSVMGGVIFWSLHEWTNRQSLELRLTDAGFADFVPEPRTPPAALRDALEEVYPGPEHIVRNLKGGNGFQVFQEERGDEANRLNPVLTAKINEEDYVITLTPLVEKADEICDAFNTCVSSLRSGQVSGGLVKILDHLNGTRLRPRGGIYWLRDEHLDQWDRVREAVEMSSQGEPHQMFLMRHRMDDDAIRAVQAAIIAEVEGAAARINLEVSSGKLEAKALENREEEARQLRNKVEEYETLLGVSLEQLRIQLGRINLAGAKAALLQAAG